MNWHGAGRNAANGGVSAPGGLAVSPGGDNSSDGRTAEHPAWPTRNGWSVRHTSRDGTKQVVNRPHATYAAALLERVFGRNAPMEIPDGDYRTNARRREPNFPLGTGTTQPKMGCLMPRRDLPVAPIRSVWTGDGPGHSEPQLPCKRSCCWTPGYGHSTVRDGIPKWHKDACHCHEKQTNTEES